MHIRNCYISFFETAIKNRRWLFKWQSMYISRNSYICSWICLTLWFDCLLIICHCQLDYWLHRCLLMMSSVIVSVGADILPYLFGLWCAFTVKSVPYLCNICSQHIYIILAIDLCYVLCALYVLVLHRSDSLPISRKDLV